MTAQTPDQEQLAALVAYAAEHGRNWKARLLDAWYFDHREQQGTLRQIRNQFGPTWLMRFKLPK